MKRNTAIILTVASALLCGCPGLILCVTGILVTAGTPFTVTSNGNTTTQPYPVVYGIVALVLALILILIPIVIGIVTLRKKKAPAVVDVTPDEPLPPVS